MTSPGTLPAGRAAFVDALGSEIERTAERGTRLAAAVVCDAEAASVDTLADIVREAAKAPVYLVGPRAVAVALPGTGRAEALGILARVEASCGARGSAVELEAGETATQLAVRVLAQPGAGSAHSSPTT